MTTIRPVIAGNSRGFLAGFAVQELQRKIATPPYNKLWELLVQRAREQIAAGRKSNFSIYTGAIGWLNHTPAVLEAALMALLANDADARAYVHECIKFIADFAGRARPGAVAAGYAGELAARAGLGAALPIHSHAQVAMAADILRPQLSDEALGTLLNFMRHTAIDYNAGRNGYTCYSAGNNIAWCQSTQAAVCALLWGDDCAHPAWRTVVEHGIAHTRGYLKYGCDAAGFSYEGTGYGHGVFYNMFNLVQLLKQSGYTDLYAQEPRLRAIFESALQSMFPDQTFLTNDNDVGLHGASSLYYLLFAYREYHDPAYLSFWYAYQGPDHPLRPYGDLFPWLYRVANIPGVALDGLSSLFFTVLYWDAAAAYPPLEQIKRPTATYSPGTERADIRTSWSRNAVYVNILGAGRSHMSQTHRHADAGHFSLFAHGDYLAIDTGRYNSNEDQHNVVLVDGKNHVHVKGWAMDHMKGALLNFQAHADFTYLKADMAQMKGCYWADRHFFFVNFGPDQAYLVTLDNINPDDSQHSFWWQLQANHDCKFTIASNNKAALHGPRARLDLTFAIPSPQDFPKSPHTLELRQDVQEWQWPYGRQQKIEGILAVGVLQSSVRRPRLIAEVTGLNGVILAVLSPRPQGDPPLAVRQRERRHLIEIEVEAGAYRDTILAALDRGYINTESVEAMTELLFIRRTASGEVVRTWSIDGASILLKA
ncbi:MAG: heparinase II/III family protein [Lentisphaerae bacterium]|nr:heparinase II/III family protein [Lentisphaerota bacterium]